MNMQGDSEGYVYFNELLFSSIKFAYYSQVYEPKKVKNQSFEETKRHNIALGIISKEEYQTLIKLEKLKRAVIT
jgi:hypothetical protein